MLPYSATDLLRVMSYELNAKSDRSGGRQVAEAKEIDCRDDDGRSNGGGGWLIRLFAPRTSAPSPA